MAAITESNEYSPSITKVDVNNDVPNQQLANRTFYLKTTLENLQNFLNTYKTNNDTNYANLNYTVAQISKTLKELTETTKAMDEKAILAKLNQINQTLDDLKDGLTTHTHNYAGSTSAGGDANSVDTKFDTISTLCAIGVTETTPNKIRTNNKITFEDDTVSAKIFEGNLKGIAEKATNLANNPKITLTGDVIGSVIFEGDKDVVINASLKEQSVSPGEYGTISSYTLGNEGTFTVPDITVNSLGVITKIRNRTINLPKNLGINGIARSIPTDKKIYVLGTSEQAEKSATYTQNDVYIKDRHLYSNGNEVINAKDFQNIRNKTYEGYELGDACARGVDETVGGTKDDSRLITSNALYRHKHNYALADSSDGRALYVKVTEDNTNVGYLVTNNYKKDNGDKASGILTKNTNVYVCGKELHAPDLYAQDNMYIPGGKIWIDAIETPVEEDSWIGNATIEQDSTEFIKKTQEVVLNPDFQGSQAKNPVSGISSDPIILSHPLSGLAVAGGALPDGSTTTPYTITSVTGGVKESSGIVTATKSNIVGITMSRDGKSYLIIATSGTFDSKKITANSTKITYNSGGRSGDGILATADKPISLTAPLANLKITGGLLPSASTTIAYTVSEVLGGKKNASGAIVASIGAPVLVEVISGGKPYSLVSTNGTYHPSQIAEGATTVKYVSGGTKTGDSGTGGSMVKIKAGTILVYKRNGYVPADNRNIDDCDNIVLAATDGLGSTIEVVRTGRYDLKDKTHDGDNCYVGQNGSIIFVPPTQKGTIVKKIGYIEGSYLMFYPSELSYLNK